VKANLHTADHLEWTAPGRASSLERMESAIEVRQLRAFVALVERGSVTSAAEVLDLAQSTVSEALSSLERAMGTPMFLRRRGSRELVLTDAGNALLPHARSVLEAIDSAHVAVARATSGARARVIIATNESISSFILAPMLEALRPSWPNTTFAVTVTSCPDIREGVETGTYDVGLTLVEFEANASLTLADRVVVINEVPLLVFAQPSHRLAGSSAVSRGALGDFSLFITDPAGDYHELIRNFLVADGLPGPRLQPTGSVESVKRGVLGDSCALGVLPAYAIADELRERRVVAIDVRPHPPRVRIEAVVSRTRSVHPAVRELVDSVRTVNVG
jgi:DNA-binding transcriptional LysR family regulator